MNSYQCVFNNECSYKGPNIHYDSDDLEISLYNAQILHDLIYVSCSLSYAIPIVHIASQSKYKLKYASLVSQNNMHSKKLDQYMDKKHTKSRNKSCP